MKLQVEKWLDEYELPKKSEELIQEGILCYKVGAYKASLLLSYLSFLHTLKSRLEKSSKSKPAEVKENTWKKFMKKIDSDKEWDQTVFNTTQVKVGDSDKSAVYLVNGDLQREVAYWRQKRNECAHAKDAIISAPHVESFWLFLESHLSKFVINGGKSAILNKLNRFFDSRYTPPQTNPSYIVNEIPYVVNESDVPNLLGDMFEIFREKTVIEFEIDQPTDNFPVFWKQIAFSDKPVLRSGFDKFVISDEYIFEVFAFTFPSNIYKYADSALIRPFWKKGYRGYNMLNTYWEVVVNLIKYVIPEDELGSFIASLAFSNADITSEQVTELEKAGYFKELRKSLFESEKMNKPYGGFDFANKNTEAILFYLENQKLDKLVVSEINTLIQSMMFGRFKNAFIRFWQSNVDFRKEFEDFISEMEVDLASPLLEEESTE
ncbi:hypothetical protein J0K78_06360 [Halobacillus sp. GSS1]|uniref:hypothetical protein n=1 Tax=Halobacillus sp. GSS1 TaxID=2815919 RepID=UPI001A8C0A5C|nr:hypothetical protein [Halobacillus sp. GSS1]MBN9653883.1 hypothetical protein [Halobacillus sp. GSS1]